MAYSEKRGDGRISYQGKPHGTLILRAPGSRMEVRRILDISNTGIRIETEGPIVARSKVALEYTDGPMKIEVFGSVAHVSEKTQKAGPDSEPRVVGYVAGVMLMNPMTLIAMIQAGNDRSAAHP